MRAQRFIIIGIPGRNQKRGERRRSEKRHQWPDSPIEGKRVRRAAFGNDKRKSGQGVYLPVTEWLPEVTDSDQ